MGEDVVFTRYTNVSSRMLPDLELKVNKLIAMGCVPLGGISVQKEDGRLIYVQTVFVPDPTNNCLGPLKAEEYPEVLEELLAASPSFSVAVGRLKKLTGWSQKECERWIEKKLESDRFIANSP